MPQSNHVQTLQPEYPNPHFNQSAVTPPPTPQLRKMQEIARSVNQNKDRPSFVPTITQPQGIFRSCLLFFEEIHYFEQHFRCRDIIVK